MKISSVQTNYLLKMNQIKPLRPYPYLQNYIFTPNLYVDRYLPDQGDNSWMVSETYK